MDLSESFAAHRAHLRMVAQRMLGSPSDADDAVQEAWLRLSRADTSAVENLRGWLTTVVARVCLDMLRARKARHEEAIVVDVAGGEDPERETAMADAVGMALLVVLETLAPAERLAFVLHDVFDMPFEEIATLVGRSPAAARQLASRGRRRVQGAPEPTLGGQRQVVEAFVTALRGGDMASLLAVLDPDVVVRMGDKESRGAEAWAKGAVAYGHLLRPARLALVDGAVGLVMAPRGRLFRVVTFTFAEGKIAGFEILADAERLAALEIEPLD